MRDLLRSPWAGATIVALLATALYAQTLAHPFFYDDVFYVVKNPAVRAVSELPRAFAQPFSPFAPGLYRPMLTLSYAVDFTLAGITPMVFHFGNVLLHAFASSLFFFVALRSLRSVFPALATALVFAVHPVHTEAVTWVSGRSELLAALFSFASFLAFLHAQREESQRRVLFLLILSGVFYLFALLAKESAAPLPLILFLIFLLSPPAKRTKAYFLSFSLLFGGIAALYLLVRVAALGVLSVPLELTRAAALTFGERMALMAPVIVHYMKLMTFPVGLRLEYDWVSFPFWITALSAVSIAATMVLGVWLWKREPVRTDVRPGGWRVAALGIAWFFLFLLPVANIIPIGEFVAERFLYLPSAGFCLFVGALVERCRSSTLRRNVGIVSILSFLSFFSFLTIQRNAEWRDPEILWRTTLERSPNAPHAAENLASILLAKGDLAEAGTLLERQLQRFPEKPMTNYLTAQWHLRRSEREQAIPFLERALEVAGPTNIEFTDFQRGAVLLELGRFGEALAHLERASRANPYDASALNNLGVALANVGRREEAVTSFARAVQLFEEQGSLSDEEQRNHEGAKANLEMLRQIR